MSSISSLAKKNAYSAPWGNKSGEAQRLVVALIGGGVDNTHPALKDSVVDGVSFTDSPWNLDETGEGTALAGIISNNVEVPGSEKKAPLMKVTFFDTDEVSELAEPSENPDMTPEQVQQKLSAEIPAYIAK